MGNKEHECYIGIWYDYPKSYVVTFEELKEENERLMKLVYPLEHHLDWRYNTNLTRFTYCPYCGKKIDWNGMRQSI